MSPLVRSLLALAALFSAAAARLDKVIFGVTTTSPSDTTGPRPFVIDNTLNNPIARITCGRIVNGTVLPGITKDEMTASINRAVFSKPLKNNLIKTLKTHPIAIHGSTAHDFYAGVDNNADLDCYVIGNVSIERLITDVSSLLTDAVVDDIVKSLVLQINQFIDKGITHCMDAKRRIFSLNYEAITPNLNILIRNKLTSTKEELLIFYFKLKINEIFSINVLLFELVYTNVYKSYDELTRFCTLQTCENEIVWSVYENYHSYNYNPKTMKRMRRLKRLIPVAPIENCGKVNHIVPATEQDLYAIGWENWVHMINEPDFCQYFWEIYHRA